MKKSILEKILQINNMFKGFRVTRRSILLVLVCPIFLMGCYNSVELQDLAIVSVIGVDKHPESDEYEVSLQIVNPAIVTESEGVGGGDRLPVTVFTGNGKTFLDAIQRTIHKIPGQIFLGHVQIFVFSEDIARQGIEDLLDFIRRDAEMRMTSRILISKGQPAKIIVQTIQSLELLPAKSINDKLKFSEKLMSTKIMNDAKDVIKDIKSKGKEAMVSAISVEGDVEKGFGKSNYDKTKMPATIIMDDLALFKEDKLQIWIEGDYSKAFLQLINKMENTIVVLDSSEGKEVLTVEVLFSKVTIKPKVEEENPVFYLEVLQNGLIGDVECSDLDLNKKEDIAKLEKQLSERTKGEIIKAIDKAQQVSTDAFGFGEAFHLEYPKVWKKFEDNWGDVFKNCKVEVSVESNIRRSGMIF